MPLAAERVRAILFDVDGTLSDTDDAYVARLTPWIALLPFVGDASRQARRLVMWMEAPGNALLTLADTLGLDDEALATIGWFNGRRRHRGRPLPAIPGVGPALDQLHRHYALAVVSSRDEASTCEFLEQSDLLRHFDAIITALSTEHTKPHPDPVLLAASQLHVEPHDCVMVGDTPVDIRAGRSAGAQTIGVLCGFGEEAELRRQGADLVLPTTADLVQVLPSPRNRDLELDG